VTEIYMFD